MPRRAPIRIVGGHPMQNNPRPVIPFADAICVGEGETWIAQALSLLEQYGTAQSLAGLPGTIISETWQIGQSVPVANYERPLPDNPPYLNRPGTRSATWYVEIARGCPYSCAFCELGNSSPYRIYPAEHIEHVLDQADTKKTRKINFYAPDEAAHPQYHEMFAMLRRRGYNAGFSSMRIDSILRRGLPDLPRNTLIRVGVDGLTEETRWRVNKKITDDMIVEYFSTFIKRGHIQFKLFEIFGYPWENPDDFREFESLMNRVFAIPLEKSTLLRIKWTPFIPQPCTPLANAGAIYDYRMVEQINIWHARTLTRRDAVIQHNGGVGWIVENDGLMGRRSHARQCQLTAGDESVLLSFPNAQPLHVP
jgi:radical SAM superfamily enzyme YgiQ (UPF0313 family)